ncbi:MAG: DegV family protein [Oscillospiraceae bacterium]|nr:DegV family protein [Oscillospiraceae bacterium]
MIRLVVDSTCDMPRQIIEKYGIAVVPLQVVIEGKSYRDGVDIKNREFYDILRQGVMPQTSQINPADTEVLFREICRAGDDVIYLSFSSAMSGSFWMAKTIAEEVNEDYPERRLCVMDSEGGCAATGIIAMQTARWIAAGRGFDEIVAMTEAAIANIQHLFTLDSLNWLSKGGRVAKPVGYVGDKLQIKPILHVADKSMHIVTLVRGRKSTISTIIKMLTERIKNFPEQLIMITHADDIATAEHIRDEIHKVLPGAKTCLLPIGCVLATHLGVGGVGLFFMKNKIEGYDLLEEEVNGF